MKELSVADRMLVGPEYEFYIFDDVSYGVRPPETGFSIRTRQAGWAAGSNDNNKGFQLGDEKGYHASLPMDINNDLRSKICLAMKDWGIDVKYHHHEVGGCGQMEI